jgi:glycosyltransferase involved in cell wall biosynthesis
MIFGSFGSQPRIILDVDDFELTANVLTSINQRAVIHAAERLGARIAYSIVTATPFLKDHFEQLTANRKSVTMIPTGVSAPAFTLPPAQGTTLLYLGSISQSSGHRVDMLPDILKEIRQQIPEATLLVAGSGDDDDALKQTFAARDLLHAVNWHGRFTLNDLPKLLATAALLIDPVDSSITNRAKSSFRTCIAAATGRAIVTSDIGIRPYLVPVRFHTRFFAFPGDVHAYADKSIALLRNPLTPAEILQIQEHARTYHWTALAAQYQTILEV